MKIEKVSYAKIFPTGIYLNERIGFEASIENGDDPKCALYELRELAEKFHKEANTHLYNGTMPLIQEPERVINRAHERLILLMGDATTIEELAKYKKDVPEELIPEYMKKLKELTGEIK